MKFNFCRLICFVALFVSISASSFLLGAKPNVIIILADDLGYGDLAIQGAKDLRTPAIDALALDGVRFTDAYACHPFCGPSRAGLMTARYPHRYGSQTNPRHSLTDENLGVPVDELFLSQALKAQAYATGVIGKWHLGASPRQRPLEKGFDYFFGFLEGGHSFSLNKSSEFYSATAQNPDYITDVFTEKALAFVEENKDKPFFLYLAYNAPHTPLQATPEDLKKFSHIENKARRTYAAMIYSVDRGVASLVAKLKDLGLYENTLIVFTSDNGGVLPYSCNAPLSGEKRKSSNEGSHRVPFIMAYKAKVEPRVSGQVVSLLDIFPTALSLAGGESPTNLDGIDLSAFLIDKKDLGQRQTFIDLGADIIKAGDSPTKRNSIRYGKWKLISNGDRKVQSLYDLESDLAEGNDISSQYPEIVSELNEKYSLWDKNNIPVRYKHFSQDKDGEKKNSKKQKKN